MSDEILNIAKSLNAENNRLHRRIEKLRQCILDAREEAPGEIQYILDKGIEADFEMEEDHERRGTE